MSWSSTAAPKNRPRTRQGADSATVIAGKSWRQLSSYRTPKRAYGACIYCFATSDLVERRVYSDGTRDVFQVCRSATACAQQQRLYGQR